MGTERAEGERQREEGRRGRRVEGQPPRGSGREASKQVCGTSPKVATVLESTRATWAKLSQFFLTSVGIFLLNSLRY